MASRRIKFDSWPELLEAVKAYDDKGIKAEIKGFEDLSENILTVYGDSNEYIKRNNACQKAFRGQNRAQKQIYQYCTKEAKRE